MLVVSSILNCWSEHVQVESTDQSAPVVICTMLKRLLVPLSLVVRLCCWILYEAGL